MPSRLKSLELHGYKTFANRTLFEFSDMVTAVVGPNGSGKSNLADSMRWVLGEQSYSLLRAKKTEDMIFSGSESRPRAGMASATITFDNSDSWLPIDFSEVAITRRAYRDGDNEYLINGQRVRLKDVSELLAQSGLAERTYTVIGQGLVDAALSLKAEERRRLFEEAAGIGLHRSRREDALRRLETTRRNLERVEDILAELQPRLQSLERQARRAREYEQVRTDLRVLLREWYGYHWHHAQMELTEAREAAHVQETRLEQVRKEQTGLDEQLGGLRERMQALRANLSTWHKQLSQLHSQRETISRDLAVTEERVRSLADQHQAGQADLANLQQELSLRQDQVTGVTGDMERINLELGEARSQVLSARQALDARQAERVQMEKQLRETRQAVSSLNMRQGQLQALLSERQAQVARAVQSLDAAAQALARAEQEHQAAETQVQVAQNAQAQAEQAKASAQDGLDTHRKRLAAVEQERKRIQDERSAVAADMARLKAQSDVLEQAESSLTGYASGTQVLLHAARQDRLPGTLGALSKYLTAPAELEIAIAAALGDYVDAVLLTAGPEQALDLLLGKAERGVLLPVESLRAPTPLASAGQVDEGVLGVAAELVTIAPELRQAAALLLGQVWVVRDRAAARRILVDQPAGVRAVTLRGEVFHAAGPIHTFGAGGRSGEQTILSRTRQRQEIAGKLEHTGQQLAALDAKLKQLEEEMKALQAEGERLSRQHEQARRVLETAAQAVNQARLALEQTGRQARWQREQQDGLRAEITRGEGEAANMSAELGKLEKRLSETRERMRQENAALEALSLDELQAQVSHWGTRQAVAERAQADAVTRQQERQAALKKTQERQAALLARLEELTSAQETQAAGKSASRQAEVELGEQIKNLQASIEPTEAGLDALEQEYAGLQHTEAGARQALSAAEHFHAQTRITLDRRQEALQALRRRIEEDFGLVAFEYVEQVSGPTPLPLDGMVEQLPSVKSLSPEIEEAIKRQRAQLRRMGAINPEAQAEYEDVKQRFEFLTEQVADLRQAEQDVRQVISELDTLMQREFRKTFQAVAAEFRQIFTRLFGGGSARLLLTDPDDLTTTGIDIEARLPGRRSQGLSLLSGGERSLTATALIFSLLRVSPTPFCVLDEVDAMLDEANVGRFRELLRELSQNTQFVIVTHNRNTVQVAEVIYGVTMGRDSASQVLSLKLDEVSQIVE